MIINNFDEWIDVLRDEINVGKKIGMSDKFIGKSEQFMGGFFSKSINPDIRENVLLKQMWDLADKSEKEALSSMIIKLANHKE